MLEQERKEQEGEELKQKEEEQERKKERDELEKEKEREEQEKEGAELDQNCPRSFLRSLRPQNLAFPAIHPEKFCNF